MLKYTLKKVFVLFVSLYIVVTITFFLMRLIPGGPFSEDELLSEEILTSLRYQYGLDQPLLNQYGTYLKNFLKGEFGFSLKYPERRAIDLIREGFPISCTLGLEALVVSIFLGISLGAWTAFGRGRWAVRSMLVVNMLGVSIPSFIVATLLQYLFAVQLNWLPIARWGSFNQTILPAFSLALFPMVTIASLARHSMREVGNQDYIVTAQAKGLSFFQIFFKHILKNSMMPVLTYLGPLIAHIMTGSFVIEKIFSIPGLGQWFVMSVINRDYTLILSLTVFYTMVLMSCVFIIDLLYYCLDPRMRREFDKKRMCIF